MKNKEPPWYPQPALVCMPQEGATKQRATEEKLWTLIPWSAGQPTLTSMYLLPHREALSSPLSGRRMDLNFSTCYWILYDKTQYLKSSISHLFDMLFIPEAGFCLSWVLQTRKQAGPLEKPFRIRWDIVSSQITLILNIYKYSNP